MITKEELIYIDYINDNKSFLKEFHKLYFIEYRKLLKSYGLKLRNYMITEAITYNKIKDYKDFVEYYRKVVAETTIEAYEAYYDVFVDCYKDKLDNLKVKYNKADDDIRVAYEIKTVFQFYIGFLIEKHIKKAIAEANNITLTKRIEAERQQIDLKYAIDIEVSNITTPKTPTIAIQSKSISYLNIPLEEKQKHFAKHKNYMDRNKKATVFYVLYEDFVPCYNLNTNSYLHTKEDVTNLNKADFRKGTYTELATQIQMVSKNEQI